MGTAHTPVVQQDDPPSAATMIVVNYGHLLLPINSGFWHDLALIVTTMRSPEMVSHKRRANRYVGHREHATTSYHHCLKIDGGGGKAAAVPFRSHPTVEERCPRQRRRAIVVGHTVDIVSQQRREGAVRRLFAGQSSFHKEYRVPTC